MLEFLSNLYVRAGVIILIAVVLSSIVRFVLRKYVAKLAGKTKSDLDDILLSIIARPVELAIILAGFYFALKSLALPYQAYFEGLFFVIFVVVSAVLLSRIFTVLVSRWLKVSKRFEKQPRLLSKIVMVVIYIIALLMILGHFNVEITPLIATLGLGGLAVGLALQNTLSNFFAGLHIISDQPVRVGDFIELDGNVSGYVDDIGWRSTRIRTLPNTIVIVPNAKLADSVITNASLPEQEMAALVECGVAYGSDLEKVEKITIDVAKKVQKSVAGGVKTFEPFIRYHTFADSNINFTVILRVEKFVDKYLIKHEFIKALKARYDKEGIEISWPVRKVYQVKNG